jgi:2-keto-4-pentenoate hydratase/2-oxohepta-3-ene-1,7-dioic acid hydratase in catechol pathway
VGAEYRLLSYRDARGAPAAGVLIAERVHAAPALLAGVSGVDTHSVLGLLAAWDVVHPELRERAAHVDPTAGIPLAQTALLAPILYPPAIFSVWGNYVDHNAEMAALAGREPPVVDPTAEPFWVQKTSAHSVIGTRAPIHLPSFTTQLDFEAELGVVIGTSVREASLDEAAAAVAGYVILNDVTARDGMKRQDPRTSHLVDWFGMKSFADSAPMGPWLTPAAFVPNAAAMPIRLWVNGVLKQDGSTSAMVYTIPQQVAALSRRFTLLPGDVIASGCPAGVGVARREFLQVGDEIRIEIGNCGVLENAIA